MKHLISGLLVTAAVAGLYGEITFSTPVLNSRNEILFGVTHSQPGEFSYTALFSAGLDTPDAQPLQLTCFPEQMSLLNNGSVLRIKNRYGISLYSVVAGSLMHTPAGLTEAVPSRPVSPAVESVSPDGKWICTVKKTGSSTAQVVLQNASGYTETVLIPETELSYTDVPVRWSPDSSILIYEKNGTLYFTEPDSMFKSSQLPEYMREIGRGSINAVYWTASKNLIYISHDLIYRIPIFELYTRAVYSNFTGIGSIIGRLPFPFTGSDQFSVNNNFSRMTLVSDNRTVYYLQLPRSAAFVRHLFSETITPDAGESVTFKTLWKTDGIPVIWIQRNIVGNGAVSTAITFNDDYSPEPGPVMPVQLQIPPQAVSPVQSPDGSYICFHDGSAAYIYQLVNWRKTASVLCGRLISYLWADNTTVYLGSETTVSRWNIDTTEPKFLFPSAATEYAWDSTTGNPVVQADSSLYEYDRVSGSWHPAGTDSLPEKNVQNTSYRVFLGSSPNQDFTNAPYVRSLTGPAATKILYTPAGKELPSRPKIALVFDAFDNADGLAAVLRILERYSLKATFFINGEFLRRYPAETVCIATAGHECASLFYTTADLTDTDGFLVDEAFIRQGLARNEDEFFTTTGFELALLWHAPFYRDTPEIRKAAAAAGYATIQPDFLPADTITLEQTAVSGTEYMSAANLIEQITGSLTNGSVIPVSLGISGGSRSDYLYDKLDLLIGAILDAGYDIVTAGTLNRLELSGADTYQIE